MWIDTHCHLDAHEFGGDSLDVARSARAAGRVDDRDPGGGTRQLRHRGATGRTRRRTPAMRWESIRSAFPTPREDDLACLRGAIEAAMDDPRFVGIGEIGLDFFIPDAVRTGHAREAGPFFPRTAAHGARLRPAGADARAPLAGPGAQARAPDPPAGRHRACLQRQLPAGADLYRPWLQAWLRRRHDFYARAADPAPGDQAAAGRDRARNRRPRYFAGLGPSGPQQPRAPARHRRRAGRTARDGREPR